MSCTTIPFDREVTSVPHAVNADHATSADSATTAGSATTAATATHLNWHDSFSNNDIVKEHVSDNITVSGSSMFGSYLNIKKTDYTPIALFGYLVTGTGTIAAAVEQAYITDDFEKVFIGGHF